MHQMPARRYQIALRLEGVVARHSPKNMQWNNSEGEKNANGSKADFSQFGQRPDGGGRQHKLCCRRGAA
jgi:hypothetical protein